VFPVLAEYATETPWMKNNSCGRGPAYRQECLLLDPWDCELPTDLAEHMRRCKDVDPSYLENGKVDLENEMNHKAFCSQFFVNGDK
jgi:hypothetical protein